MNRADKIKLLKGIQEGIISKKVLTRTKSCLFTQNEEGDELLYEMGGKVYTEKEHDDFCNEVEIENKKLETLGLKEFCTIIITIVYVKGKTIL